MTHTRTAKRFIRTNAAVTLGLALAFVAGGPWWLWGDGGRDPMVLVLWTIGAAVAVGGFIAVRCRQLKLAHAAPTFPFFVPVEERALSAEELEVITILIDREAPALGSSGKPLSVVGRCGCGQCPTIFFQPHRVGDSEREVCSYSGKDASGGIVGVLLWEKCGAPSQLEVYSVDGHEPWALPMTRTLARF
jgi:hypothetical protein